MKMNMTSILTVLLAMVFAPSFGGQEPAAAGSAALEVRVQVTQDGRFVADLHLDDFEILEDGRPQTIEGLSYFEQGRPARLEGQTPPASAPGRRFYLLFQMTEYDAKIEEVIRHLFTDILSPDDSLTLVTPMKPYSLTPEAFQRRSKADLAKEMTKLLRKDIQQGATEYRSLLNDLRRIVKAMGGGGKTFNSDFETDITESEFGLDLLLQRYKSSLQKLESLRLLDEGKFLAFAAALNKTPGEKSVFFIYQREFRPEINPNVLATLMDMNMDRDDILASLQELFTYYKRDIGFNAAKVRRAFADAGAVFNFVFMNNEARYAFGISMKEQSEDAFRIFSDIARDTGGAVDNSSDPGAGFKTTAGTVERFYHLYYRPLRADKDGSFREITVRTKNPDFKLSYRAGYYAD